MKALKPLADEDLGCCDARSCTDVRYFTIKAHTF